MGLSLTSDRELDQLAEAFETFNLVSSQLEASYSSLESRMSELRTQLADAREQRRIVSVDKAMLERRLSSILEALPGGVVVIDHSGRVTDANRRARNWMPGLEPGVEWSQLSAQLFENEFSEHGDLVSRNGQQFVVTQERTDGTDKIILLTDVTDQRQVDEVVSRNRRLAGLGEMLATLAHQLRTPITAALLYASSAREKNLSAERRDTLLEQAGQCMRDLEKLVADMLVFARGNTARDEQVVDVADLLADVERTCSPHCSASQSLQFEFPDYEMCVQGNPRVLASALENIVMNALQCAGTNAHVTVSASMESDDDTQARAGNVVDVRQRFADRAVNADSALRVRIAVADDGPGIRPGEEERIFEPFYSSRRGGTGLGLAAARSIVRAHRGDVVLHNDPSNGARFVVSLPLIEAGSNSIRPAIEGAVQ